MTRVMIRRRDDPARDDHLDRFVDFHIETAQVAPGQKQKKTLGRQGRRWNEDADMVRSAPPTNFAVCRAGHEAQNPCSGLRKLEHDHFTECGGFRRHDRLENLFDRSVQASDNRHPVQEIFGQTDEKTPQKVRGKPSTSYKKRQCQQQSKAWNRERKMGIWIVFGGDQLRHFRVDEIQKRYRKENRQKNRRGNQNASQKPSAQTGKKAVPMRLRRYLKHNFLANMNQDEKTLADGLLFSNNDFVLGPLMGLKRS